MGREFDQLFDEWAITYDTTIQGVDEEYEAVFEHYDEILDAVASRVNGIVVEFGVGTGNLSKKLIEYENQVIGIEPSTVMREKAVEKLPELTVMDGDFLEFSLPINKIDAIVSTYAFHHLTDEEKLQAVQKYNSILNEHGKIVFADTVFENEDAKLDMVKDAINKGFVRLAEDLQTEYYTTIPVLTKIFEEYHFTVTFKQLNNFVWLIEAQK